MIARKMRWLAVLVVASALGVASAPAQDNAQDNTQGNAQDNVKRELYRANVNALDSTGWQLAASTKGAFSVLLPVPFTDASIRSTEPELDLVVHLITGVSADGVRFSVTAMSATGKNAKDADIGKMPEDLASKRGSQVRELVRDTKNGADRLSFLIANPQRSAYMLIVKTRKALYQCVLEFPEAQRAKVLAQKDKFFGSFKIKE